MSKKKDEVPKNKMTADYSSVGIMFPASIAVGLAIGYYLDEYFKTQPWLLILFTLYGIAAGFWNLIKIAGKGSKRSNQNGKRK